MKNGVKRRWMRAALGLLALALAGCSTPGIGALPTATIDERVVATRVQEVIETEQAAGDKTLPTAPAATESATGEPSATAMPATATLAPIASATAPAGPAPEASALDCPVYTPQEEASQPLPAAAGLKWQTFQGEAGRFRMLSGFFSPVLGADAAPGGRWWAARVLSSVMGGGGATSALYFFDTAGGGTWQAAGPADDSLHRFAWAGADLVWVDQGQAFRAGADGSNRAGLKAPEALTEIWVGASGRALAAGETGLWRLDLASGAWSRVEGEGGDVRMGPGGAASNLALDPGGTYAALAAAVASEQTEGALYRIPLEPGKNGERVGRFVYYGRGGRLSAPIPLANSPLWVYGEMQGDPTDPGGEYLPILDSEAGKWLIPAELLPEGQSLVYFTVSPGGRWLGSVTVPSGEDRSTARWTLTVAPAEDVRAGMPVEADSVVGWRAFPPAAFIVQGIGDRYTVLQLNLDTGSTRELAKLEGYPRPAVASGSASTLLMLGSTARLFGPGGEPLPLAAAPLAFGTLYVAQEAPTGEYLLAGVQPVKPEGQCEFRFPVVMWAP